MPLKVGDFAPLGQLLDDAILYAAANGARVVNFSFKVAPSAAIDQALDFVHDSSGVFLTGAAGNTPEPVVIYQRGFQPLSPGRRGGRRGPWHGVRPGSPFSDFLRHRDRAPGGGLQADHQGLRSPPLGHLP
jgi:hypothetical protein